MDILLLVDAAFIGLRSNFHEYFSIGQRVTQEWNAFYQRNYGHYFEWLTQVCHE